jgi:uncharacterized flavoprotein (TIGR03862 family)
MGELPDPLQAVVIGGGPAGLMAAERLRAAGCEVDLFDAKGSVGRKFLIAGKGGLNLSHAEPRPGFDQRYAERASAVGRWLDGFDGEALREWARGLGVETFVGSSGRVFPVDLKAAPLLRGWVRRLRAAGVRMHMQHRCLGWDDTGRLCVAGPAGEIRIRAKATVLALGGGSWSKLGSDGAWVEWLRGRGVDVADLKPANCGFEATWKPGFIERHAGAPIKPIALSLPMPDGTTISRQGELIATRHGIEGGLAYALSAPLREAIARDGFAEVRLDLLPGRDLAFVQAALSGERGGRSLSEHLRRRLGLSGVRAALLRECLAPGILADAPRLASAIKSLPLRLTATRPLDEAISSAGGVRLEALDEGLMLEALPGIYCCGEMLDWEAPTGGYLLTACFASGRIAGDAAARRLLAERAA